RKTLQFVQHYLYSPSLSCTVVSAALIRIHGRVGWADRPNQPGHSRLATTLLQPPISPIGNTFTLTTASSYTNALAVVSYRKGYDLPCSYYAGSTPAAAPYASFLSYHPSLLRSCRQRTSSSNITPRTFVLQNHRKPAKQSISANRDMLRGKKKKQDIH